MSPESPSSILIVETDEALAHRMSVDLQEAGFEPLLARGAESGWARAWEQAPSLVVIDWSLAGESGLDLCQRLRHAGNTTPILLLMAHDTVEERIACLEAGADDYILKPYRADEFLERICLYLKPDTDAPEQLRFADLVLDLSTRRAVRNGRGIDFTMKEFELLKHLMEHPNEVMTRDRILEQVWGYDFRGASNVIEVYIRYLRLKIEEEGEKRLIHTVRGVGYVLRDA